MLYPSPDPTRLVDQSSRLARLDVIVPTFRRPAQLERCLGGLAMQTSRSHRVLVVARPSDRATRDAWSTIARSHVEAQLVDVDEPGVIAAMTAGVRASEAEYIAFTDDDAIPRPDWVQRMLGHLGTPGVGAAGGRDAQPGLDSPRGTVGTLSPFGRITGNHHLGVGPVREVHLLKGVNMGFRREALVMPRPGVLWGSGAQPHFEILICQWAVKQGWKLVYDPAMVVDHYPGVRFDPDRRAHPSHQAVYDSSYNQLFAAALFAEPLTAVVRVLYSLFVGDRSAPGMGRLLLAALERDREIVRRWPVSTAAKVAALRSLLRYRLSDPEATVEKLSPRSRTPSSAAGAHP